MYSATYESESEPWSTNMRLDAVVAYITMTVVAQANEANISTDEQLRIWAFLGAVGGALVGSLLPSRITTLERVKRWVSSFITALVCVGVAVKGFSIKLGPDEVMFAAAAIGFCAWGFLKILNKEAPNFLMDRFRALLGLEPMDREESQPSDSRIYEDEEPETTKTHNLNTHSSRVSGKHRAVNPKGLSNDNP